MQGIFQIISHQDGRRTEPFTMSFRELYEWLKEDVKEVTDDDFLLCLMTRDHAQDDPKFATAPLITLGNWRQLNQIEFKEENNDG